MITAQTHYRAYFDIQSPEESRIDCARIARVVRKWITDKERDESYAELGKSEFFTGTDWIKENNSRVHVHTVSNSELISPCTLWSLRYEHPDSEHSHRLWVSDITLQQVTDQLIRFAMHVYFRIAPGYIGADPPLPLPNTPKIISRLLTDRNFIAKAGSSELTLEYTPITALDARYFPDDITKATRKIPYVVISEDETGNVFLNPTDLALKLAGNAKVYLLKQDAQQDYNLVVGYYLGCSNGMVRVYKPLPRNDQYDAKRHRFFRTDDINRLGTDAVTAQLVSGLVRRGKTFIEPRPVSREDALSEITRMKMQGLRKRIFEGSAKESQIHELSETFEKLLSSVEKERDDALAQIEYLENECDTLQSDLDQSKEKIFARDQQMVSIQEKVRQFDDVCRELEALKSFANLPDTIAEVANLISKIHCSRLIFTKEAHDSASDAEFEDISITWKALWHLGTTLPNLVFDQDIKDIEGEFRKKTGFEISFTEGKMTKKDPKLLSKRIVQYDGKTYEMIPHLKAQKGGKLLRVHFSIDRQKKKIIVGHCGDHLDTYGTRRLS